MLRTRPRRSTMRCSLPVDQPWPSAAPRSGNRSSGSGRRSRSSNAMRTNRACGQRRGFGHAPWCWLTEIPPGTQSPMMPEMSLDSKGPVTEVKIKRPTTGGLGKNCAQLFTLFALGSVFLLRRRLMASGRVCPKTAKPPLRRASKHETSRKKPVSRRPNWSRSHLSAAEAVYQTFLRVKTTVA